MNNKPLPRAGLAPRLARTPFESAAPSLLEMGYEPMPIDPRRGVDAKGRKLGKAPAQWDSYRGGVRLLGEWPERRICEGQINAWMRDCRHANFGIGVRHSETFVGLDLDTSDTELIAKVAGYLDKLNGVPVRRVGRKGFAAYFRCAADLPRRKLSSAGHLIEFPGQTVLPPSIHPDTDRPYVWITSDTLCDTPLGALPFLSSADVEALGAILHEHTGEPVAHNKSRLPHDAKGRRDHGNGQDYDAAAEDDLWDRTNGYAFANLSAWVEDLGLTRCQPDGEGYRAVPSFRASNSGKTDNERGLNLTIHPLGITDWSGGKGYTPILLVMATLSLDFGNAWRWLYDRVAPAGRERPEIEDGWGYPAPANDNPAVPPHDVVQTPPEYVSADAGRENVGEAAARFFRQTVPDQWDIARKREALFEASKRGDISQHEYNAQAPADLPMMLIQAEAGLGKTSTVLPHVVAAARIGFRIVYAVPEHLLAVEVAEKIKGIDSDVSAMVWEGIERPGMCRRLDEVKALRSIDVGFERRLCRGVDENAEGGPKDFDGLPESRCRYFDQCPYRKQVEAEPQIVIVTHAALKTYPKLKGDWDVVVIDEDFAGDPVKYSEHGRSIESLRTTPPKLEWCDGSLKTEPAPEEIVALWHSILDALAWHVPADASFHGRFGARADLLAIHGINADAARDMVDYLAQQMAVTRDLPDGDVEILAGRAAERQRAMRAHLSIARAVRDVLAQSRGHSGRLWIRTTHDGKVMVHAGTVSRLDGAWIKGKAILYLDATPSPDFVVEAVSGRTIGERIEVHVERSRDMKVVQVVGAGFDKKNILSEGKTPAEDRPGPLYPRMDGFCRGIAAHIPGQTLIVPRARLVRFGEKKTALVDGETVEVLDYESGGKMAGRNKWERWQGLIITANTELGPAKVEIAVGILTGDMAGSAPLPDVVGKSHPKPKYPRERILCQTREGKHFVAHRKGMFDPLCAAYDKHVTDKSFRQTMARLRGVNRDGAPGLVIVVADTDLPFAVDHQIGFWHAHNSGGAALVAASKAFDCGTTLEIGDSIRDVPQTMSVVLASAGLIHLATPDRFKSADTAKKHVQRHPIECPTGWQTEYVIPEEMRSRQKVHYDPTMIELDDVPRAVEQMIGRQCRLT